MENFLTNLGDQIKPVAGLIDFFINKVSTWTTTSQIILFLAFIGLIEIILIIAPFIGVLYRFLKKMIDPKTQPSRE